MQKELNSFSRGVKDGLPICFGYFSVSFAFGIFATGCGLEIWQTLLVSMFNVTSAGQLAAVPIIAALGSIIELILTQLVINSRYSLMSISLSQRLSANVRLIDRFLIAYVNTDEVFAVAMSRGTPLGRRYMYGLILSPYLGWSFGTLFGAVAGNILPALLVSALGIAIYAMFVAIVVPEMRINKRAALAVLAAALISCAFTYAPIFSSVPAGFVVIITAVAVSLLFALAFPIDEEGTCDE